MGHGRLYSLCILFLFCCVFLLFSLRCSFVLYHLTHVFKISWHSLNLKLSIQILTIFKTFLESLCLKVTDWNDKQVHLRTYQYQQ